MITLTILFALYGLISLLRTYLAARKRGGPFDMDAAPSIYDYFGILLLIALAFTGIIVAMVKWLP